MPEKKNEVVVPTSQRDLEARHKADYRTDVSHEPEDRDAYSAPYAVEGNNLDAYVGVDPCYMTYANDTEKPLVGDGIEDKVAKELLSGFSGEGASIYVTHSGDNVKHAKAKVAEEPKAPEAPKTAK